jgi:hypothetical protein
VSIAKRMGISEQGVRSACARMGVRPVKGTRSRHQQGLAARRAVKQRLKVPLEILMPRSAPQTRRIVRLMLDTDWTMERVAEECGVARQRVNGVWRVAVRWPMSRAPAPHSQKASADEQRERSRCRH